MVSQAKKMGGATTLWPNGIDRAKDVPVDLLAAIEHASMVLSWYENRKSEEIPPQWMWLFDGELEAWFDRVDEERKSQMNSGSSTDGSGQMTQNTLAKGRGRDA